MISVGQNGFFTEIPSIKKTQRVILFVYMDRIKSSGPTETSREWPRTPPARWT